MKIECSSVKKIHLSDIEKLDPITVYLEDSGVGKGKITIECHGESWSAYWNAMGDITISQFVTSCNEQYLAQNLSSIKESIDDLDAWQGVMKKRVVKDRREGTLSAADARDLIDRINHTETDEQARLDQSVASAVFGSQELWFDMPDIPKKTNPRHAYLCRIISAVKEALSAMTCEKVTEEKQDTLKQDLEQLIKQMVIAKNHGINGHNMAQRIDGDLHRIMNSAWLNLVDYSHLVENDRNNMKNKA